MPWWQAGAAILGGLISSSGSKSAANKGAKGSRNAIVEQRRQFNLMLQLLDPQRRFGDQAINELSRLFGFDPTPLTELNELSGTGLNLGNEPLSSLFGFDVSGFGPSQDGSGDVFPAGTGPALQDELALPTGLDVFRASPDFRFVQEEGLEGVAQTLGAGGAGAFSGNALRELNRFNTNLASGEFTDFINRRLAAANLGQVATSQAGQGALTTGLSVGNALQNQANIRASGVLGQTAAAGNVVKDLLEIILANKSGNSGSTGTGVISI